MKNETKTKSKLRQVPGNGCGPWPLSTNAFSGLAGERTGTSFLARNANLANSHPFRTFSLQVPIATGRIHSLTSKQLVALYTHSLTNKNGCHDGN